MYYSVMEEEVKWLSNYNSFISIVLSWKPLDTVSDEQSVLYSVTTPSSQLQAIAYV